MKPEEIKAAFAKSLEAPAEMPDQEQLTALHAPGYVIHSSYGDYDLKGAVELYTGLAKAFPDLQYHLEKIVLEGDTVAMRYTGTGTHKGEFLGVPPTGKKVTYKVMGFLRIAGDKIDEAWEQTDVYGVLQQLGAIPAPKK